MPPPEKLPEREEPRSQEMQRLLHEADAILGKTAEAKEDSDAYEHAALAVHAFIARSVGAAALIDQELRKDDELPAGSDRKLRTDERRLYEDFITQAEANAVILPLLIQQVRIVQYQPDIQKNLEDIYHLIGDREQLIHAMELSRAVILHAGEISGRAVSEKEIAALSKFATVSWMLRQRLTLRPNSTRVQQDELNRQLQALQKAEAAYKRRTNAIGDEFEETRQTSEKERRTAGVERVTQGFPGGELVLDTPDLSMKVWEELLLHGGQPEKKRAARQLGEALSRFQEDFLQRKAFDAYVTEIEEALHAIIARNDRVRDWFRFLRIEAVGKAVTTDPQDFQSVFDEVTKQLKTQFDRIATPEHGKSVQELSERLHDIEKGKTIDEAALQKLLADYADIQQLTGHVLSDLQRWQVAKNAERNDNPARGGGNMLEHLTRVGDKTLLGTLRDASPYGVFRTRAYVDERSGRIVLIDSLSDEERSLLGHAGEAGKLYLLTEAAILIPIFHGMASRIPLLGRIFRPWYLRWGIPVAMAEASQAAMKETAGAVRAKQAADAVEGSVKQLQRWKESGEPGAERIRKEADTLFEHLVILLQSGLGKAPSEPDPRLALEAHIYTNQLLTALHYPPYHELSPVMVPQLADDMSPEMKDYVRVFEKDRKGVERDVRLSLESLRSTVRSEQSALHGSKERAPSRKEDAVTLFLRTGDLPVTMTEKQDVERLLQRASQAPDFRRSGGDYEKELASLGNDDKERTQEIFKLAGDVRFCLRRLHQLQKTYKTRDRIPPKELQDVESDVARLAGISPKRLMAAAYFLRTHQPSNEDIAAYWYREEYPGKMTRWIAGTDRAINRIYGTEHDRTHLGDEFLADWSVLWDYGRLLKKR